MNSNEVKETLLNIKKDYEESLEYWQKEGSVSNAVEDAERISALEYAINAVEKQGCADILSENTICGFCPRCNRLLEKSMVRPDPYYCPNCG